MTKLEIWNAALAMIPHDRRVKDPREPTTEALRCRDCWERARRKVLLARDWNFLAVELPVQHSHDVFPAKAHSFWPWRYWRRLDRRTIPEGWICPRPDDALRVLGLYDRRGRRVESRSVGGIMVSREPAATLRFLLDSKDPKEWPAAVQEAVAAEMAAELCPVLSDNAAREQALKLEAADRLTVAGRYDALEGAPEGSDGLEHIRARRW